MYTDYRDKLLQRLEDGRLDWETVCRECITEMSMDEVKDMCDTCEYLDDEPLEEDDE
jgi:hypothetical protein